MQLRHPTSNMHAAWVTSAQTLGLDLRLPAGVYDMRATFKTLKRCLGAPPPQGTAASAWHWMYGRFEGVEVVACNSTRDSEQPSFTAVAARIEPSLLAGLEAYGTRERGFATATAWHRGSTSVLLAADPMLDALFAVPASAVRIADSAISLCFPGMLCEPQHLLPVLRATTGAAKQLAARRVSIPKSEGERSQEAAWRSFATSAGLVLDDVRMELSGVCAGAQLRIGLDSEPHTVLTTVHADLPGSIGLGLQITKQRGPSFLTALTEGGDLPTGDKPFDDAFIVRGNPAVAVQRLLWNATLRRAIDDLGRAAFDFELTDHHLYARYGSALSSEVEVRRLFDTIGLVVATLFPRAGEGPYR